MAVNNLDFNQLATVLTSIVKQATGQNALTPTNTNEFVSIGNTALLAGYDKLATGISQVLQRTIFSVRPYYRKFAGLEADSRRWGAITRKLSIVDKDFENATRFELVDGQEPTSMFSVRKPIVLLENFYGANIFDKAVSIYRDQLDQAFTGPDQFGEFLAMVMGNISDMREQAYENMARATIGNLIGGIIETGNPAQVIHLLTEYNTQTGLNLTATTVYQPTNFPAFVKWVFGRVAEISAMLTERTTMYHTNVTGKTVARHTPYDRQKVYLYAPTRYQIDSRVIADTFHDSYLRFADTETVNFWQSIQTPDSINVKASYLNADGTIGTADEAQTIDNIFGVIFDEDAAGVQFFNEWAAPTPFDARNGFYNDWYHWTIRYWNSFTENAIVLLMD
ncbi:MAG: hypothetical protein J6F33_04250 [Acidaminococcaceae bacterium]|nr:hypothetical protein [Acidaminococcaceae bacterium]